MEGNKLTRLPNNEVNVKLSLCNKCKDIVRAAIEHEMDKASKKDFMKEVLKYNLDVKTIPLLDYRNNKPNWCNCK
jgi:hypothetical protein